MARTHGSTCQPLLITHKTYERTSLALNTLQPMILQEIYVTKEGLRALKDYKYVGVDHSIIGARLQPFWRAAVELLPTTIAYVYNKIL